MAIRGKGVRMKDFHVHVQYCNTCQWKNELWFSNLGFNGLFSIDLRDYLLKYQCQIPFLSKLSFAAYTHAVFSYKDKVLFFPNNCNNILFYNLSNKEIKSIPINPNNSSDICPTIGIAQWNQKIWIFPQIVSHGVWILDLFTFELEKDEKITNELKEMGSIVWLCELNEEGRVCLSKDNEIAELDLKQKKVVSRKKFKKDISIHTISYDGTNYWILQNKSTDVYKWNKVQDKLEKYQLSETEWIVDEGVPYNNIIFFKNQIILLPARLKYIMKIDQKNHMIGKAIDYPSGFRFIHHQLFQGWAAFSGFNIIGNQILLHPVLGNMLLIYNIEENRIEGKELVVSTQEFPFLVKRSEEMLAEKDDIFNEQDDIGTLQAFTNIVNKKKENLKEQIGLGKNIYKEIIEL